MYHRARTRTREEGVYWGLALVTIGGCLLLMQLHVLPSLRQWWPLIVIGLGLARLATARSPHALGSGVSTSLIGGWLLIAANQWYGLGWTESWPLALVAAGL